jgi:hypothetical protein
MFEYQCVLEKTNVITWNEFGDYFWKFYFEIEKLCDQVKDIWELFFENCILNNLCQKIIYLSVNEL